MSDPKTWTLAQTALLTIDLQNDFLHPEGAYGRAGQGAAAIAALPGAEIHAVSDTGKLVVTLEAHSTGEMLERIAAVQGQDGVLASAMVYQHIDTLDSMNEEIDDVNGS